jgi:DNA-binding NtrC family response regulator
VLAQLYQAFYHWPGNVRELQNVIKRFVLLDEIENNIDKIIGRCDMHGNLVGLKTPGDGFSNPMDFSNFDQKELPDPSSLTLKAVRKKAVDKVEAEYISNVLNETSWNRSKATEILSISYKTLLSRIKELNLRPPQ